MMSKHFKTYMSMEWIEEKSENLAKNDTRLKSNKIPLVYFKAQGKTRKTLQQRAAKKNHQDW